MKVRQSAFVDQVERARKHLLRFGRETGDDVGAEHDVGTNAAQLPAERDSVVAGVPPLHALEDEIVAGLKRQMQMRHQAIMLREGVDEIAIGLD